MKLVSHWSLLVFVLLSLVSVTVNAPVDCVVSGWSEWGELVDDTFWETRTRSISVFPSDGGAECPTPLEEFRRNVCRRKIDLLFVIDGSSSVGLFNFNKVIKAIINGLMTLSIDSADGVQVGIVVFSTIVTTTVPFMGTQVEVVSALLALKYPHGGTRTDLALNAAADMFRRYARNGSEPLVMVLTDGASNRASRTIRAAISLRQQGIAVAAIGITQDVRISEIKAIASIPRLAFFADTFAAFVSLLKPLTQEICDISKDLNVTALPPNPTEEVPVETSSCLPEIVISTVLEECPTTTVVSTPKPEVVVTTMLKECATVTVERTPSPLRTTETVVSTVQPVCPSPSIERIVSTVVEECETITIENTPDPIRTTVVSTVHSATRSSSQTHKFVHHLPLPRGGYFSKCITGMTGMVTEPVTPAEHRVSTVISTEECSTITLEITPSPVTETIVTTVPPDCPTTPTLPPSTDAPKAEISDACLCSHECRTSCCKLEIVFAIKVSARGSASTFGRAAFDSARGYIKNLFQTDYFTANILDDLRVGFLVYSADILDAKNVQEYDNKQSLLDAVDSMTYQRGDGFSRVDLALRRASVMWHSKCSRRLVVVFTDGVEDSVAMGNLPAVRSQHMEGVSIVVCGIQNNNGDVAIEGLYLISTQVILMDWVEQILKLIIAIFLNC